MLPPKPICVSQVSPFDSETRGNRARTRAKSIVAWLHPRCSGSGADACSLPDQPPSPSGRFGSSDPPASPITRRLKRWRSAQTSETGNHSPREPQTREKHDLLRSGEENDSIEVARDVRNLVPLPLVAAGIASLTVRLRIKGGLLVRLPRPDLAIFARRPLSA
jgi:hypothetical protein